MNTIFAMPGSRRFAVALIAAIPLLAAWAAWSSLRLARLEAEVAALREQVPQAPRAVAARGSETTTPVEDVPAIAAREESGAGQPAGPAAPALQTPPNTPPPPAKPRSPERVLTDLFRALAESEAGQALGQMGGKSRAAGLFGTLISEFGFNEAERDYFLTVAGQQLGADDKLWRDLLAAETRADRLAVLDKHEADAKQLDSDLKTFFNNAEDNQRYHDAELRVAETEQINGLRGAMANANAALTPDQEARLADILHEARIQSGIDQRWKGRGVLDQLERPGMADRLRADWNQMQAGMSAQLTETLDPAQLEVFQRQQHQAFEGLLGGVRFAEAALRTGND